MRVASDSQLTDQKEFRKWLKAAHGLGGTTCAVIADVRVGVRKTQTTFARKYTFAIANAPTKRRMDLGLRLPGVAPTQRLAATNAFSDNATHCVALTTPAHVDPELTNWLKAAYETRG